MPVSVAMITVPLGVAGVLLGVLDHPAGREHVHALGVDVAGGDVLHDAGRAAALGVDQEVGAGVRGAHVGRCPTGRIPACTWHSPSQTCILRPTVFST